MAGKGAEGYSHLTQAWCRLNGDRFALLRGRLVADITSNGKGQTQYGGNDGDWRAGRS